MSHHTSSPILLATALLLACSIRPLDGTATDANIDSTSTTSTTSSSTTAGTATDTATDASTDTVPQPGTQTSASDTTDDIPDPPPPDLGVGEECDLWNEDCPEGQKCMPASLDGDSAWESLLCVPIAPDPDPLNASCQLLGTGLDGLDTCEHHTMCWSVDPDTGNGTCLGLCTGTPDAPTCADPGAHCQVSGAGVVNLCIPKCDPLLQNCLDGNVCIPTQTNGGAFVCVIDPAGVEGHLFDPCEYANACDPGLYCLPPDLAAECDPMAPGCCLPFCDLSQPNTCPGQDQQCLPWHEPNQAPPGEENIGICGLPIP